MNFINWRFFGELLLDILIIIPSGFIVAFIYAHMEFGNFAFLNKTDLWIISFIFMIIYVPIKILKKKYLKMDL